MKIFIDGDELVYKAVVPKTLWKCGWKWYSTKKEALAAVPAYAVLTPVRTPPHIETVKTQIKSTVNRILRRVNAHFLNNPCTEVTVVLSGVRNFRKESYPDYKSNRSPDKPFYFKLARDFIQDTYKTVVTTDQEADDELGILSRRYSGVIASSDKDFDTIPGDRYHIMKDKMMYNTLVEANRNHCKQMLIGDRIDGVTGCPGIGPVKAGKILDGLNSYKDMLGAVVGTYQQAGLTKDAVQKAGFLVYIRRNPGEMWSLNENLN